MSLFGIPIFPEQASSFAKDVDALYFFIVAVCAFFALLVVITAVLRIAARRRESRLPVDFNEAPVTTQRLGLHT